MRIRLSWCALLAAVLLTACSYEHHDGNGRLKPEIVGSIMKGSTTKDQVRALLGNPQSTKQQIPVVPPPDSAPLPAKMTASEIWAYWHGTEKKPPIPLSFFSAKKEHSRYTLFIFFDSNGTVLDSQVEVMNN